jgi:Relaxase/Mobilisation nuclease domain
MPKRRTVSLHDTHPLLNIVSYGRGGPLTPLQIEQVSRTVRRIPEVMVKVTGGGRSPRGVVEHLRYIGRRGKEEIEMDDGRHLEGRGREKQLAKEWDLEVDAAEWRRGRPGRKPAKLTHHVVLSMPQGTSAQGLFAAARQFARKEFGSKHRYAMVLHTDQGHPHVHVVVRAMGRDGRRLNIYKATLRSWRREFANQLRAQGIAANATERVVRGVVKSHKPAGIYWPMRDPNRVSRHMRKKVEIAGAELNAGKPEPGKAKLVATRGAVERAWQAVSDNLRKQGQVELADQVDQFLRRMPPPRTEREQLADDLRRHIKPPPTR